MEEILYKFIDDGKREQDEMRAFICDFQTTNELKERNNSLIELRFGVQELLKVMNNVQVIDYEVKGVTTRGGKTTTQNIHDNNTDVQPEEPPVIYRNKLNKSTEDDECYGIDDLDDTINEEAQKLLANEEPDLFLSRGLEKIIEQSRPRILSWDSPIHVVPKKGGMTVVLNDNNELIPSRTVTGWRVCIDYHKLNDATQNDHFPLPFIDQMLERLCGNKYYCFLDGFSGFFQILIAPKDQEKTTFTCPYGTFAYRQMSFGLCNAPATFQRCMTAIFHDMVEDLMEVFMDDF
ncbi:reverse transcriptase domain-containing protein [Tanacetum coccineum]